MSESKSFLFVWWEGGGNMPPVLSLVRALAARGHRVRVLGDPVSETAFVRAGASFVAFEKAPHRRDCRPANDPLRDWEARNPVQAISILRDRLLVGPALAYAEDTMAQIRSFQPDALAIMDFTLGAMMAAERSRIPAAVIAPHILTLPAPGVPPFGPGFFPARNGLERLRDRAVSLLTQRTFAKGLPAYNAARSQFGLAPVPSLFDQVARMQRFLVMTSAAFDYPCAQLPPNVRYVGPALCDPDWAVQQVPEFRDAKGTPVVLLSFSTTFQNQAAALRRAVDALGALPVRGVVTVGPALSAFELPRYSNVSIYQGLPHSLVLPHADLMVSHAGHGSVIRSLAHGVPLVCAPMGRDQNDVAARVVYRGAGVRVSPKASVEDFRTAIGSVLDRPQFRTAARKLGEQIRRDARIENAVRELELLAGAGARQEVGLSAAAD